ncbi:MAG: ATP-binding protein [Thermoanaerobaculia bacterium]|nr:ATP-binding protein [Thermoanaerobaculia bacterium]
MPRTDSRDPRDHEPATELADAEVVARLRRAIAAAGLRLWDWDLESDLVYVNDQLSPQFGLPGGEQLVPLSAVLDLVHPDDVAQALAAIAAVRAGTSTQYAIDQRIRAADGTWRWVASRGRVTEWVEGRAVRISGTSTDIDERKRAEERLAAALADRERLQQDLLAADRKKDDFIATLAHELRNPLAPIRGAAALLRQPDLAGAQRTECLEVIDRQVGQMAHLLEDLLDVSRFTRGKITLRVEVLDLAGVIAQAVEVARPMIESAQHRLVLDLPAERVWLEGDATRLSQIFSNLLTNAAKYSEPGGLIHLGAQAADGRVTVAVTDTGIGLAAEHLPLVFEMFSQVERAQSRSQGGLGLGLSLVKGLVEMHGGTISAHSPGLGQGSRFVVELPTAGAPQPVIGTATGGPPTAPPAPLSRVLVVDDNRDVVTTLALVFELEGHEVRRAYEGEGALAAAREFRPDFVLLDLGLPGCSGYEVCRRLRSEPWGQEPFVVALTGWGQDDDKRRTSEAGFDLHLVKPVLPEVLLELVRKAHGMRRTSSV